MPKQAGRKQFTLPPSENEEDTSRNLLEALKASIQQKNKSKG